MELIVQDSFTDKLERIVRIGNETETGMIFGFDKDDNLIPLSQEIFELVVFSLVDDGKTIIECFDRKFKLTLEQL